MRFETNETQLERALPPILFNTFQSNSSGNIRTTEEGAKKCDSVISDPRSEPEYDLPQFEVSG